MSDNTVNILCRCCHTSGKFRSLTRPYVNEDAVEIYSDMLQNTFGIIIHPPPVGEYNSVICEFCIEDLRKATGFKKQVMECEERFEDYYKQLIKDDITLVEEEAISPKDDDDVSDVEQSKRPEINDQKEGNILYVKTEIESPNTTSRSNKKSLKTKTIRKEEVWITIPAEKQDMENEETKLKPVKKRPVLKSRVLKKSTKTRVKKEKAIKQVEPLVIDISLIVPIQNDETTSYSCQACGGSYQDLKKIKDHILHTHQNRIVFNCKYCDVKSYTKLDYNLHKDTHGSQYICDYCDKRFFLKRGLRQHIYIHIRKVICDYCGKVFSDKVPLKSHIDVVHKKIYAYSCNICGEKFKANKYLKIHYRTHTGARPYECSVCKETFISFEVLQKHAKNVHDDKNLGTIYKKSLDTEFKRECKICFQRFTNRAEYIRHTRREHPKPKDLQCGMCKKNFSCKYSLRRHVESHSGVKKFPCDICNKMFSQKPAVYRHKMLKHNPRPDVVKERKKYVMSEKSHGCNVCGKKYTTKGVLNRHISEIHTRNVSFVCVFCGLKLSSANHLKRHIQRKHNQIIKTESDFDYSLEAFTINKEIN